MDNKFHFVLVALIRILITVAVISCLATVFACENAGKPVVWGLGGGAAVGAAGGAILNHRNKAGNAALGAIGLGIVGALIGCVVHRELEKRDERVRKETLFRLDTFGVSGIPPFRKYEKWKEKKDKKDKKQRKGTKQKPRKKEGKR